MKIYKLSPSHGGNTGSNPVGDANSLSFLKNNSYVLTLVKSCEFWAFHIFSYFLHKNSVIIELYVALEVPSPDLDLFKRPVNST